MLEGYFWESEGRDKMRRLLAVQAALEIAKHSVGNANQATFSKANDDLSNVAKEVSNLADAIQAALDK